MGSDHGEGDVAERSHTEGVWRAEREQEARSGRDLHSLGLKHVALGLLEAGSPRVDGCGFRAVRSLYRPELIHNGGEGSSQPIRSKS